MSCIFAYGRIWITNGQSAGKPLKEMEAMSLIAINAIIGDGCISRDKAGVNYRASFNGKNLEWVTFKWYLAVREGFKTSKLTYGTSGYTGRKDIATFSTKTDPLITMVARIGRKEILKTLTKMDLILWYIDDGSWHKRARTMHLYCNDLSESEVQILIQRIGDLYGVCPSIKWDRKKDGRQYPYLYFPRALTNKFWRDVRRFIKWNGLNSLTYKVGETSTTIRNGVGYKRTRKGEIPDTQV